MYQTLGLHRRVSPCLTCTRGWSTAFAPVMPDSEAAVLSMVYCASLHASSCSLLMSRHLYAACTASLTFVHLQDSTNLEGGLRYRQLTCIDRLASSGAQCDKQTAQVSFTASCVSASCCPSAECSMYACLAHATTGLSVTAHAQFLS